jgi:reactive intermediate/imine deaminase
MMKREVIATAGAPKAIGVYSQAVRVGDVVYLSGQVPLDPATGQLVADDIEAQVRRVFENLKAVAAAAGCTLDDAVRFTVFMTDLTAFPLVNQVMAEYLREPYPTRSTVGIAALPRGARIEIDCILHRSS